MLVQDQSSLDEMLKIVQRANDRNMERVYKIFYGDEQFTHEPTPYSYIEDFVDFLKPKNGDVIYDLGSGYGRFAIYCALVTKATIKGIELIPERSLSSRLSARELKLKNVNFYCANAIDFDFSDGDIFFLFNPFNENTLSKIGDKLEMIARHKQITIATWGGPSNRYFANQSWLEKIRQSDDPYFKLDYFRSSMRAY